VSEVVTSIMMNYVVQFFAIYLVTYHFREASSSSLASVKFLETSQIPTIIGGTRIHAGVVVALLLCVALWLFMFRSKLGFKMRLTGDNPSFAHYVGVREKGVMVAAQVIAGGIAGAGGGVEVLSMYNRFKWTATPGYGWTGIVVALLAKNNPLLVPFAACFISYINTGANVMAMNSDVGSDMALVIQGAIMLLIASSALLQHWRQKLIVKAAEAEQRQLESQAASAEQYERV
ncbi:MAG: ABC transporter permease, partial [Pseudoflavonifractor sp.]